MLNGDTNIIDMGEKTGSYAIYAEKKDKSGNGNSVKSGDAFGSLWVRGNIESTQGGEIALTTRKSIDEEILSDDLAGKNISTYINGSLMAVKEGTISLKTEGANGGSNVIYASEKLEGTDLSSNAKKVVSALYTNGGSIEISGLENTIASSYENIENGNGERTIWAENGGTVTILGKSSIGASNALVENGNTGNSAGLAVVAGTESWGSGTPDFEMDDTLRSHVNINYAGESAITGDVVAGYGGNVTINADNTASTMSTLSARNGNSPASMHFTGNALAGNGGNLVMQFGDDSYWTGRADDYQDASLKSENAFYAPQFSNEIQEAGTVDISLGTHSYWNVTGQSWATSLSGNNSVIDLRGNDTGGYALHVGKLTGNNTFVMNLNHDEHYASDMLYIADTGASSGVQTVQFKNIAGWENMEDGEKLRFATVNANESELSFVSGNATGVTYLRDRGMNDMAFSIDNEQVNYTDAIKQEENESYNGSVFGEAKPSNELIEENYNTPDSLQWFLTKESSKD